MKFWPICRTKILMTMKTTSTWVMITTVWTCSLKYFFHYYYIRNYNFFVGYICYGSCSYLWTFLLFSLTNVYTSNMLNTVYQWELRISRVMKIDVISSLVLTHTHRTSLCVELVPARTNDLRSEFGTNVFVWCRWAILLKIDREDIHLS